MSTNIKKTLKAALRQRMKNEILKSMSTDEKSHQSQLITEKILQMDAFQQATNISIYLSTANEVDTTNILNACFRLQKHVFVPSYKGNLMEMLRVKDLRDFNALPLTKWHIKQPSIDDNRENALTNGHGIDLFLIPGVAFTKSGGRMGHGMGYYDTYLRRHQNTYPNNNTALIALAFREQIVAEDELPLEENDVRLHQVITA